MQHSSSGIPSSSKQDEAGEKRHNPVRSRSNDQIHPNVTETHTAVPKTSPSGAAAMKRSARVEKRKKKTVLEVKPSSSLKTKRRKNKDSGNKERRVVKDSGLPQTPGVATLKKESSEERRELHRVNERQRHQSLNGAINDLVKILPAGDAYKSVTKYTVLQKANDYIDFLQHKINRLCLEQNIEQKNQDGRLSFSVPFNTIVGGEELKIPASTPISPKILQSIHKSARNVPLDQLAQIRATERDKKTTPVRFCRFRLKKKSPKEKTVICKTRTSNLGVKNEEILHTVTASILPTHPENTTPVEVPSDSDHDDLVVDETPPISPLVVDDSFISWKQRQPPKPVSLVSNNSCHPCHHRRHSWPRNVGSPPQSLSASVDREQRPKQLLDHYFNVDSSPDGGYAIPTKPEVCCPLSIPLSSTGLVGIAPIQSANTPRQHLHSEHSYSARFLPTFLSSGIPTEASLPSDVVPLSAAFNCPAESSQVSNHETVNSLAMMPSQGAVGDTAGILSPALYIHQQPISLPIKMVTQESTLISTTLVHPSLAASAHPTQTTTTTLACKSIPRYVPIQPATSASNNDAVPATLLAFYGATSENSSLAQNDQATVASAQKLVADPNCLRFDDADSPAEIMCDNGDASIMTPAASAGCPMRRSWINGYQLFTKVNHPRFREKWPRLQGREITRLLSQAWKELPVHFKKNYSRRAREWNQWHRCKRESANQGSKED